MAPKEVAWTFLGDQRISIFHHKTLRELKVGDFVLYDAEAPIVFNRVEATTGYRFKGEAFLQSVAKVVEFRRTMPFSEADECVGLHYFWRTGQIFAEADVHYPRRWKAQIYAQKDARVDWVTLQQIERTVHVLPFHEVDDLQAYERGPGAIDPTLKDRTRFWYRYTYDGETGALFAFTSSYVRPEYIDPARKGKDLYMLDACAGMGTVSLSARAAGLVPSHFVEIDQAACDTISYNFDPPSGVSYPLLVPRLDMRGFVDKVKGRSSDVPERGDIFHMHLSAPCQQFSRANRMARKAPKPYDDAILRDWLEAVELLGPDFLTLEQSAEFVSTDQVLRPLPAGVTRDQTAGGGSGAVSDSDDDATDEQDEPDNGRWSHEDDEWDDGGDEVQVDTPEKLAKTWNPFLLALFPLLDMGYQVRVFVHQLSGHGVPSRRLRCIMYAAKEGRQLPDPAPMRYMPTTYGYDRKDQRFHGNDLWAHMTYCCQETEVVCDEVTCEEAFGDLPAELPGVEGEGQGQARMQYYGGTCGWGDEKPSLFARYMRIGLAPHQQGYIFGHHKNPDLKALAAALAKGEKGRLLRDRPMNTLLTQRQGKSGREVHPAAERLITIAEMRRAMSLPDHVHLCGGIRDQIKQLGNGVPYLFGHEMCAMVLAAATGRPPSEYLPPLLKAPFEQADEDDKAAFAAAAVAIAEPCAFSPAYAATSASAPAETAAAAAASSSAGAYAPPSSAVSDDDEVVVVADVDGVPAAGSRAGGTAATAAAAVAAQAANLFHRSTAAAAESPAHPHVAGGPIRGDVGSEVMADQPAAVAAGRRTRRGGEDSSGFSLQQNLRAAARAAAGAAAPLPAAAAAVGSAASAGAASGTVPPAAVPSAAVASDAISPAAADTARHTIDKVATAFVGAINALQGTDGVGCRRWRVEVVEELTCGGQGRHTPDSAMKSQVRSMRSSAPTPTCDRHADHYNGRGPPRREALETHVAASIPLQPVSTLHGVEAAATSTDTTRHSSPDERQQRGFVGQAAATEGQQASQSAPPTGHRKVQLGKRTAPTAVGHVPAGQVRKGHGSGSGSAPPPLNRHPPPPAAPPAAAERVAEAHLAALDDAPPAPRPPPVLVHTAQADLAAMATAGGASGADRGTAEEDYAHVGGALPGRAATADGSGGQAAVAATPPVLPASALCAGGGTACCTAGAVGTAMDERTPEACRVKAEWGDSEAEGSSKRQRLNAAAEAALAGGGSKDEPICIDFD